ncbi:alpha/beta hydrolase [Sporomusa aerivorans]|uniref:alpha/beta hydrolase n=1 Tax=Sporomusa aerivorans TaxID=204936 RepID=UPI00352AEA4E
MMKQIVIPNNGKNIAGVLHPASRPQGKTLIISHGFRGTKDGGGRAVALAEAVAAIGFNVIRYDFTPLQNLSCQIAELTAVVSHVRQSAEEVFLLGRSMGGSASLAAAADQAVNGLILWSTPWDLAATFRQALGVHYERLTAGETVSLTDNYGRLMLTPDFIQDFRRYDLLGAVSSLRHVPLLILQGSADSLVAVSQAQAIYSAAPGPVRLIIFPAGDHHLTDHAQEAGNTIIAWLEQLTLDCTRQSHGPEYGQNKSG